MLDKARKNMSECSLDSEWCLEKSGYISNPHVKYYNLNAKKNLKDIFNCFNHKLLESFENIKKNLQRL